MKLSKSIIAASVVALLPLASFAGEKEQTSAPKGAVASAQFDTLDTNSDGRISPAEASADAKLVFASVDKNRDGYLDTSEYSHRDMSMESTSDKPKY